MIDPLADRAVHRQLADLLRDRIRSGELQHGALLPTERALWQEFGVARSTVRQAVAILRSEGLVQVRRPYGTYVRRPERRTVRVQRGSQVTVRMPSPEERRAHGLPEGVPIVELTHPSGRVEVLPADEVTLTFS